MTPVIAVAMIEKDRNIKDRTSHILDGIQFEILVTRDEGWFWGKWECLSCGDTGQSSKLCISTDDAMEAAKANLFNHANRCEAK